MEGKLFTLVGSNRGRVGIDLGEVTIVQPTLKNGASFPVGRLAAVVRQTEIVDDPTIYQRRVRKVKLSPRDANVLLVFSEPLFLSGFAVGAERSVGITKRQRKEGLAVDVIGLTVDEPDVFVAALVGSGITLTTLPDSLSSTVGVAGPADRERLAGEQRSVLRKLRNRLVLISVAGAALFAARLGLVTGQGDSIEWSEVVWRIVVAAVALFLAALVANSVTTDRSVARAVRERPALAVRLGPLVYIAVLAAVIFWVHGGHHLHGGLLIALDGVVAGIPSGVFVGYLWKKTRLSTPTDSIDSSPFLA